MRQIFLELGAFDQNGVAASVDDDIGIDLVIPEKRGMFETDADQGIRILVCEHVGNN